MAKAGNLKSINEKRVFNTGNYAFSLGLIESHCGLFAFYPGTPISEIYDHLKEISNEDKNKILLDNAINETVAFSEALGAAWSGVRSAVAFKHLGMNLIADVLHTALYSGIDGKRAGMVIICGGDPACTSSTNSQDNRFYSLHTKLPILEPWDVDSCRYLVRVGFELSESLNLPVMVYTNSRLCHSSGFIYPNKDYSYYTLKKSYNPEESKRAFNKDPSKYWNAIHWAIANQTRLNSTINLIKNKEKPLLFKSHNDDCSPEMGKERIVFITSGICTQYVHEFCRLINRKFPVLQLILTYPVSEPLIRSFITKHAPTKIIICEELEPYIENSVKIALYGAKFQPEIIGKDFFPLEREFQIGYLYNLFREKFGIEALDGFKLPNELITLAQGMPIREPTFCPGCSHRNTFYAMRKAADKYLQDNGIEIVFGGDIGCYTLGMSYPYNVIDWLVSMGAGVGISNGVARVVDPKSQYVVALIGDSTFFHSGIPPLINLIKNNAEMTVVILDNYTTAMTGHQSSVSTPISIDPENKKVISINDMLAPLHVDKIIQLDGYNIKQMTDTFLKTFKTKGLNVIIVSAECALNKSKRLRKFKEWIRSPKYLQISESCQKCDECYEILGCTAIQLVDGTYKIIEDRCMANFCDVCHQICPNHSIYRTILNVHDPEPHSAKPTKKTNLPAKQDQKNNDEK